MTVSRWICGQADNLQLGLTLSASFGKSNNKGVTMNKINFPNRKLRSAGRLSQIRLARSCERERIPAIRQPSHTRKKGAQCSNNLIRARDDGQSEGRAGAIWTLDTKQVWMGLCWQCSQVNIQFIFFFMHSIHFIFELTVHVIVCCLHGCERN